MDAELKQSMQRWIDYHYGRAEKAESDNSRLTEDNRKLREALAFYQWRDGEYWSDWLTRVEKDSGRTADEALASTEGGGE